MSASIALTKYIYPLENPISLSGELGYTLDNPRTEQEIELVKNFIAPSVNAEGDKSMAMKVAPAHVRVMLNLEYLINHLSELPEEQYAHKFFQENRQTKFLELIAKSWIIIRFSTEVDIEKVLNSTHYLRILSLDDTERMIIANSLTNFPRIVK